MSYGEYAAKMISTHWPISFKMLLVRYVQPFSDGLQRLLEKNALINHENTVFNQEIVVSYEDRVMVKEHHFNVITAYVPSCLCYCKVGASASTTVISVQ